MINTIIKSFEDSYGDIYCCITCLVTSPTGASKVTASDDGSDKSITDRDTIGFGVPA